MKRKIKFICLCLFVPLLIMNACTTKRSEIDSKDVAENKNDEKFNNKDNEKDARFVVDNVSNIYDEIRLSEIAQERATDAEIKKVAKEVKERYTGLLDQLKKYAATKAISVPTGESEKERSKIEKLLNDKTFDKDWSSELRDLNKETIDNFEKGSASLADTQLKEWVTASLPEIRRSHDHIMACNNRLK